jgi:hypothetical protein
VPPVPEDLHHRHHGLWRCIREFRWTDDNRDPRSRLGDVVAEVGDHVISAECKGGIINTKHPGQVSRLYKGLCETVGMLMATPSQGRQVAVVPFTEGTLRLAERLAPRCALAGIQIAWSEAEAKSGMCGQCRLKIETKASCRTTRQGVSRLRRKKIGSAIPQGNSGSIAAECRTSNRRSIGNVPTTLMQLRVLAPHLMRVEG